MQTSRKILLVATDPDLVRRITECLTQDPLSRASGPALDDVPEAETDAPSAWLRSRAAEGQQDASVADPVFVLDRK